MYPFPVGLLAFTVSLIYTAASISIATRVQYILQPALNLSLKSELNLNFNTLFLYSTRQQLAYDTACKHKTS